MRRFTTEQRDNLENSIIKEARDLFSLYGYSKTSIKDITEKVSIAQGTFYLFFPSKAQLYFTILELEEQSISEQLLHLTMKTNEDPKQYLKRAVKQVVFSIEKNRLLRELLVGNNLQRIIRNLPNDIIADHITNDEVRLLPIIHHWQSIGIMFTQDVAVIAALLRSFFLLTTHQEEIGTEHYKETIELMIDATVEAIVREE